MPHPKLEPWRNRADAQLLELLQKDLGAPVTPLTSYWLQLVVGLSSTEPQGFLAKLGCFPRPSASRAASFPAGWGRLTPRGCSKLGCVEAPKGPRVLLT